MSLFNPHPWTVSTDIEVETVIDGDSAHAVTSSGDPVTTQQIQTASTVQAESSHRARQRLVFPVSIPPLGHSLYRLRVGHADPVGPRVHATGRTLTNQFLDVAIDPATGWLNSLVDRRSGLDLVGAASGPHTVITPDSSDTWGHRLLSYVEDGAPFVVDSVTCDERGPHRGSIRVESRFNRSALTEVFTVSAQTPVVRVDVLLDWREQLTLFKLRIPTALEDPRATYEVPFGSIERPVDSVERPGQSWVDLSGTVGGQRAGLAVVNTAKYAYDVTGANIGITAARSPVFAWHHPETLDATKRYSYQDQGLQRFSYLLVPHGGNWVGAGIPRWAASLLMPPAVTFEHFHPGKLPSDLANLESPSGHVLVTAVKASEDNPEDTVIRAVELAGAAGPVDIKAPLLGRDIRLEFAPFEIKTVLVPADPSAPIRETDLIERPIGESVVQPRPADDPSLAPVPPEDGARP